MMKDSMFPCGRQLPFGHHDKVALGQMNCGLRSIHLQPTGAVIDDMEDGAVPGHLDPPGRQELRPEIDTASQTNAAQQVVE